MRGHRALPLLAAAALVVSVAAGVASAADGPISIGDDPAVAAEANGLPARGEPVQVGPTLPPKPPLPPGESGDQSLPDQLEVPANSGEGRRIVYSNHFQRIWAFDDNGELVKTHRVSGKEAEPGPGTYTVWSRSFATFAEHNPTIRWNYMVRFAKTRNGGNIGFHEIPTQCVNGSCWKSQTVEQLGHKLSGGCLRQSTADAIWIWNWATIGTKVVVVD